MPKCVGQNSFNSTMKTYQEQVASDKEQSVVCSYYVYVFKVANDAYNIQIIIFVVGYVIYGLLETYDMVNSQKNVVKH